MKSRRDRHALRIFVSAFAVLGLVLSIFGWYSPQPASADESEVYVNVHLCDADLTGLTVYEIAPLCDSQGTGLPVKLDNGSGIVLDATTDGSGLASYSGLFPGGYYLYVYGPAGYPNVVAGCREDDYLGNPVTAYSLMPIGGLGDVNFFFATDGNYWYCDFFLYDPAYGAATYGSVMVNKHSCPSDYDGYSADIYELAANCHEQDEVDFYMSDSAGGNWSATTPGSGLNSVQWDNVPSGDIYIEEQNYPSSWGVRIFCKNIKYSGDEDPELEVPTTDHAIVTPLKAGWDMLYCDWFNIKYSEEYVTVYINKHECPEDYYSTDPYELAAECNEPYDPYTFKLDGASSGNPGDQETGSEVPGGVQWENLEGDTWYILEFGVDGYAKPVVFCKLIWNADGSESSYEQQPVETHQDGWRIQYDVDPGYTLWCDWFNVRYDQEYVTVYINKYECPDDYYSSDLNDLYSECNEPYDPYTFKLDGASSGNPGDQETGSEVPGGVQWDGLEGDTWYILEFGKEGYGEPVVYCKLIWNSDGSESSYQQQPVETHEEGWRIQYDVDPGYTLWCDWFNVKYQPYVGIYIHKYGCPPSYESSWGLNEFYQYCQTIVQNAKFSIEGPDGWDDTTTLSGIDVWWEQLPPGDYYISELQPSSWSGGYVYCAEGEYGGGLGDYFEYDLTDNGFGWSIDGGKYLDCYWYNIPKQQGNGGGVVVDPNAPATLIIVKYNCEEGYDPLSPNADPEEDCEDKWDGIEFQLVGSQNASLSGETGDDGDGTVKFDGLKAGSYLIRESYPEDYSQAFIWSCESDYRVFDYPFSPFARIDATGSIKVSLIAGETLTCYWFDVPSPHEEEENGNGNGNGGGGDVQLTINVRECPGAQANPSACDPAFDGVGVSLSATSGDGGPLDFETDEDGVISESVEADEYDVEADDPICLVDSTAFTDEGTLDLTGGGPVEVTLYLCA